MARVLLGLLLKDLAGTLYITSLGRCYVVLCGRHRTLQVFCVNLAEFRASSWEIRGSNALALLTLALFIASSVLRPSINDA